MAGSILLIEDESAIADAITYALKTEGFSPEWRRLGAEGLALIAAQPVDLVILDVGLPDMNGFDVCKRIRRLSDVPILFLTARSDEIDRVVGFEIGADDYVAKPFSPRELVARVKAILKRAKGNAIEPPVARPHGQFFIDEARARISYRGVALELTRYEYLLLKFLVAHPGHVFSRAALMDRALGSAETSLERSIDAHIKTLRAKLRAIRPDADPITTHRGLGYSLSE